MRLEQLIHTVEASLVRFGKQWMDGDGPPELALECERLLAEIAPLEVDLAGQRSRHTELVQRLRQHEAEIAQLPEQIEDSFRRGKHARSMWQALLLERRRDEAAADRAELARAEHLCWSLNFRIRRLRKQLEEARAGLRAK